MAHIEEVDGKLVLRNNWHVEDIQERQPGLSDSQASEVLEMVANGWDANVGINWDVIDVWIDEWKRERGITTRWGILNTVQNEWWRKSTDSDNPHLFDTKEEAEAYVEAEGEKMDLSEEEGLVCEFFGGNDGAEIRATEGS